MNNENAENTVDELTVEDAKAPAEAVVEDKPAKDEPIAVAPVEKAKKNTRAPSLPGATVSGGSVDTVTLGACVFKNKFARKSLSIHHVQRRLVELGHNEAAADNDGWYGDRTMAAVAVFQATESLEATGTIDMATLNALFHDDPNVVVAD